MTVDFTVLQDWPDAASIERSAENIGKRGDLFAETVTDAQQKWRGLMSCYHTPHQDQLYSSLDPAVASAGYVRMGTSTLAVVMGVFASTLASLSGQRVDLIKKAEAANSEPPPVTSSDLEEKVRREGELQAEINTLAQKYKDAVEECVSGLSGINSEGRSESWVNSTLMPYIGNANLSILGALGESRIVESTSTWMNLTLRLFGHDFHPRLPWDYTSMRYRKLWEKIPKGSTYLERFGAALREAFIGPRPTTYSPVQYQIAKTGPNGKWFGLGAEKLSQSRVGVSGFGRMAGRGLFLLGTGLTFAGEYGKAQEKLASEQPGLSESERNGKAAESATVRTGSQVGTAALVGAGIGAGCYSSGRASCRFWNWCCCGWSDDDPGW